MEELQIQSGELLFNSKQKGHVSAAHNKSAGKKTKELFCNTFVYEPTNISEKILGNLYMVGEVELPYKSKQHNSSYLINLIASIIKREYYSDPKRSPLESIEIALVKANFALSDFAENGNIDWMHNLHFAIATIADNTLHLTQTGYAKCLLLRGEEMTDIGKTLPSKDKEFNPLKTFLHVASGTIELGDKIIFTTPEIFNTLSLEKLRRIVVSGNTKETVKEIQNIIEENDSSGAIGFIIVDTHTQEITHLIKQKIENSSLEENIILEEQIDIEKEIKNSNEEITESLTSKLTAISLQALKQLFQLSKKYSIKLGKTIITYSQKTFQFSKQFIKKKLKKESIPELTEEKSVKIFQSISCKETVIHFFTKIFSSFKNFSKKQKAIILAIIFLLISFALGTVIISSKKEDGQKAYEKNIESLISTARNKINETQNSLSSNDFNKTKTLLEESNSHIEKIKQNVKDNSFDSSIQEFLKESENIYNKLHKISKLDNIEFIGKVPIDSQKCVKIKDTIYCYGLSSNFLYKINIPDGKTIITDINNTDKDPFEAITTIDNLIILLTKKPSIITYNTDTEKSSSIDLKIVDPIIAMESYLKYVYLVTSKNEIIKVSGIPSGQAMTSKWTKKETTEEFFASDLSIDGDIFVVNSNGSISKYSSGNFINNFSISNVDHFNSPEILSLPNTNLLYFLDKIQQRIIISDKEGYLINQILSSKFDNLKNIFLEKDGSIYTLCKDKIYKIKID